MLRRIVALEERSLLLQQRELELQEQESARLERYMEQMLELSRSNAGYLADFVQLAREMGRNMGSLKELMVRLRSHR